MLPKTRLNRLKLLKRLLWILPLVFLQTSCASFIPGVDRILFRNSSAQVGPLVTTEEQYPSESTHRDADVAAEQVEPDTTLVAEDRTQKSVAVAASDKLDDPAESETKSSAVTISPAKPAPRAAPTKPTVTTAERAPVVVEPTPQEIAIEYGTVAGKVVLTGDEGQVLPTTGTMITLTPKTMAQTDADRRPQVHIIDMEDKTYQPRYSAIHAGDQVVFVNKDNIRHNVFSSSGNNAFDLGTYGAGLKRAVTLKESGIVKIYCNIHSEMATFIAVGNQGLSTKVDDQGRYRIRDVLPGTYEMSIWNIRGETKREITVRAGKPTDLIDRIDTTAFKIEPHKNKFGGKYSKNATLFEDEFY